MVALQSRGGFRNTTALELSIINLTVFQRSKSFERHGPQRRAIFPVPRGSRSFGEISRKFPDSLYQRPSSIVSSFISLASPRGGFQARLSTRRSCTLETELDADSSFSPHSSPVTTSRGSPKTDIMFLVGREGANFANQTPTRRSICIYAAARRAEPDDRSIAARFILEATHARASGTRCQKPAGPKTRRAWFPY